MAAATLVRDSTGLVLPDPFTRANSNTVGNGWSEPLLSEDANAVRILDNQLQMDDAASGLYRSGFAFPDSGMVQMNVKVDAASVFAKIGIFSDLISASPEDSYGFVLDEAGGPQISVSETTAGSGAFPAQTAVVVSGSAWWGLRGIWEKSGGDLILTTVITAGLTDGTDLSKPFTNKLATFTDSPQRLSSGELYIFSNTGPITIDEFIAQGRNLVINGVPTGWKGQVGTETAVVESGGVVTIDVDLLNTPQTTLKVLTSGDAEQASLTLTDDIWGGDIFTFTQGTSLSGIQVINDIGTIMALS